MACRAERLAEAEAIFFNFMPSLDKQNAASAGEASALASYGEKKETNRGEGGGRGLPFMMSIKFPNLLIPSPTPHSELICTIEFTQPHLLCLLFHDHFLSLLCSRHIWKPPNRETSHACTT